MKHNNTLQILIIAHLRFNKDEKYGNTLQKLIVVHLRFNKDETKTQHLISSDKDKGENYIFCTLYRTIDEQLFQATSTNTFLPH